MRNKISSLTLAVFVAITALIPAVANAQETVTIPLEDLKQLERAAADSVYWKGVATDRAEQIKANQESITNWKSLLAAEKKRADEIQEGRIGETLEAVNDLKKANFELHRQHEADQREKKELHDENVSLRSSRKYYFIGGAALGAAGGGYLGYQLGKGGIPGIPGTADNAGIPRQFQGQRQFGLSIKF